MQIITDRDDSITHLSIELERSWAFQPGQYVYLTVLGNTLHDFSFMQSHPYLIAWAEGKIISLLVERQSGFSSHLYAASNLQIPVFIDGPYAGYDYADEYDKILCLASGVGIAAHLLFIKNLLWLHKQKRSRARRIDLYWIIETPGM